jgi:RimJ/RimL family protein N-acetyltransferase
MLIPLATEQVGALLAAASDPAIYEFFPWRLDTRDAMAAHVRWLLDDQRRGVSLPFAIVDRSTDAIVGSTRLHTISQENRSCEIGTTWLSPAVWRTGVNPECKYLLLRHCFEVWKTVRVQLKTDVRNERSQRAIEGLGAVKEGILRQHWILPNGRIRDSVLYSILLEEWPEVKRRMEARLMRDSTASERTA